MPFFAKNSINFCSSNCLINDVGIYVFFKKQGYHFYAAPLSWDIRLGQISRQEGLEKTKLQMNIPAVEEILAEIGYYRPVTGLEKENSELTGLEVAVIGMAGRFPGARHIHEFWDNLKAGKEAISFFSTAELEEAGIEPGIVNNPAYVKAKGHLDGVEFFDSFFFDYTVNEAQLMDPQVRIFHECAWAALEDAGYEPGGHQGKMGLYAGASDNFYWQALSMFAAAGSMMDPLSVFQLTSKDFLTARVSFKLNLRGPVFFIQTACYRSCPYKKGGRMNESAWGA